jgi:hypothetical protein
MRANVKGQETDDAMKPTLLPKLDDQSRQRIGEIAWAPASINEVIQMDDATGFAVLREEVSKRLSHPSAIGKDQPPAWLASAGHRQGRAFIPPHLIEPVGLCRDRMWAQGFRRQRLDR